MKKIRYPLYVQTLGMLFAYLSVLLLIVFLCFDAQFGLGWDALLKSPAGDRAEAIADAISLHLNTSERSNWNDLLTEFGQKYGVAFYVFDIFGHQLGGDKITIPPLVEASLKTDRFPHSRPFFPGLIPPPSSNAPSVSDPYWPPPPGLHPGPSGDTFRHPPSLLSCPPHVSPNMVQVIPLYSHELPILRTFGASSFVKTSTVLGLNNCSIESSSFMPPPPFPHMHAHNKFILQDQQLVWICVPITLSPPSLAFPIPAFLIATSSSIWQNKLLFDFQFMGIVLFGVLLFSVVFWWPFVFKITHKLSALTVTAENIAEGNFKTPIQTGLNDEIDRLSIAIKSMALRLDSFVQKQKRFLGDISHEFITPLAKLDMALELFDTSNTKDRSELIADIKDEVREMNLMVNELLAFAKAGLQSQQIELEPVSILAVVQKAISRLPGGILITVIVDPEAIVLADPTSLLRAISNVLRNSVRYAGDAGPISVRTTSTQKTVSIVIADCGPGVPEEILSNLGEPFFRPEFSRNRDSGGVGLGLAIVKSCIECCQGQVTVSNRPEGGLQTEITLKKAFSEPVS